MSRYFLRCFLFRHAGEEVLHPLLHLLFRQIFLVCAQAPGVPERIGERAVPITPELVSHRHSLLATSRNGLFEGLVNVVNIDVEGARAATQSLRGLGDSPAWRFV